MHWYHCHQKRFTNYQAAESSTVVKTFSCLFPLQRKIRLSKGEGFSDMCFAAVLMFAGMVSLHLSINQWNLFWSRKTHTGPLQPASCSFKCLLWTWTIQSIPGRLGRLPNSAQHLYSHSNPALSSDAQGHKVGLGGLGNNIGWINALHSSLDAVHSETEHAL